jgi:hypothetical protein
MVKNLIKQVLLKNPNKELWLLLFLALLQEALKVNKYFKCSNLIFLILLNSLI